MTLTLTKSQARLWSIDSGVAMVVTDLHGDGDAYHRYRDRFLQLLSQGKADVLVFTGDLLHNRLQHIYDASLEIVVDIIKLKSTFGNAIIVLCGNHELPHIYGFGLAQGNIEFTPPFEKALSDSPYRIEVAAFLQSLPFYLRTTAGVSLTHAGAADSMTSMEDAQQVFAWDHAACLARASDELARECIERLRTTYARISGAESYDDLVRHYLAVETRDDPRYDDLLRGFFAISVPGFDLVHTALFTKCERTYGDEEYAKLLTQLLAYLSKGYMKQQVLVAGHMTITGGHALIADRHLRLASAHHATPRTAGEYLLFDTAKKVHGPEELLGGLGSVFEE